MIKKFVFLFLFCLTLESLAFSNQLPIKGFQEWKSEKIQASNIQMAVIKSQMLKHQNEANRKNLDALARQLDQIKFNIEVLNDLTMTDYLILYLSQHPHPDRFQLAASKMSTREVAQLMEAYANTLSPTPTESVVRPLQQAVVPARLPVQAIQNRGQVK